MTSILYGGIFLSLSHYFHINKPSPPLVSRDPIPGTPESHSLPQKQLQMCEEMGGEGVFEIFENT